jgi:hypothetical protein
MVSQASQYVSSCPLFCPPSLRLYRHLRVGGTATTDVKGACHASSSREHPDTREPTKLARFALMLNRHCIQATATEGVATDSHSGDRLANLLPRRPYICPSRRCPPLGQ